MAGVRIVQLSLALLAVALLAAGGAQAFDLNKVCEYTTYIDNCKTFIPQLTDKTPNALTQAVLKAGISSGEDAANLVSKALSDPKTTGTLKKHLETCQASFNQAVASLNKAEQILEQRKPAHEDMMSAISEAMAATSACEDAFEESLDIVSPVADATNQMQVYIANALALGLGVQNY